MRFPSFLKPLWFPRPALEGCLFVLLFCAPLSGQGNRLPLPGFGLSGLSPEVHFTSFGVETAVGWETLDFGPFLDHLVDDGVGRSGKRQVALRGGGHAVLEVRLVSGQLDGELRFEGLEPPLGWSLSLAAQPQEFISGLMERVVDGPQHLSWAPGLRTGLDLKGERVRLLVQPSTALYCPFFLSSRGYGFLLHGTWPASLDLASWWSPDELRLRSEGPRLTFTVLFDKSPAAVVQRHSALRGLPFRAPSWTFGPWRWRDEHRQLATYHDGSPATGPFNSQVMEDVLLMEAYGIPCSVYWIDRPWGPGPQGYDDFEIDASRLPQFEAMVRWLESKGMKTVLWIGPFFQGKMKRLAQERRWSLRGQHPDDSNYPLVDFSHPQATAYWQLGVEKLLRLGVAGFKLDRGEEDLPEIQTHRLWDGRSIRESRNDYPVMYLRAAHEVAQRIRGSDFVTMPRAAYAGSSRYGIFWGGDIGGTQEGLRASIIALQRAALLGFPVWGADTCGYLDQNLEEELCARWLAFSAFNPLMEVGPTQNRAFWDMPYEPRHNRLLLALWRLYARLHARLAAHTAALSHEASETGLPIVRPLFFADPSAPLAWREWDTFLYGPDLLVAPIWEKGVRQRRVYLPSGADWRNAWTLNIERGGSAVTVAAELHQIPLFVRVGSPLVQVLGDLQEQFEESLELARQTPRVADLARRVSLEVPAKP